MYNSWLNPMSFLFCVYYSNLEWLLKSMYPCWKSLSPNIAMDFLRKMQKAVQDSFEDEVIGWFTTLAYVSSSSNPDGFFSCCDVSNFGMKISLYSIADSLAELTSNSLLPSEFALFPARHALSVIHIALCFIHVSHPPWLHVCMNY